jgi:hypothetical protein
VCGKFTATVPWAGAILLAALISLAACSRDNREADIKKCISGAEYQAAHTLPRPNNETTEEHRDRTGDFVADCMEKVGYIQNNASSADARCVDDVVFNPYCYRRAN